MVATGPSAFAGARPVPPALPDRGALAVQWALYYARRGWHVFPVHRVWPSGMCSCEKIECPNPGKHPRSEHGLTYAPADPAKIERWWRRMPQANIGVRTGPESGFFAVDEDPRHGGDVTWAALVREH